MIGDARVVWDGASFAASRVCAEGASGATLRLARVSTAGDLQGTELEIAVPRTATARPGLIATQDRAVLAYAGNTYVVAGASAGSPVLFAAPPADTSHLRSVSRASSRKWGTRSWHRAAGTATGRSTAA